MTEAPATHARAPAHRPGPGTRSTHDDEVRVGPEEDPQVAPHKRWIVGDQYPDMCVGQADPGAW